MCISIQSCDPVLNAYYLCIHVVFMQCMWCHTPHTLHVTPLTAKWVILITVKNRQKPSRDRQKPSKAVKRQTKTVKKSGVILITVKNCQNP